MKIQNRGAITRRTLLRSGLQAAVGLYGGQAIAAQGGANKEMDYLEAARGAARWITRCKVAVGGATAWPADPAKPDSIGPELYRGVAGVVLFLLEMHHAAGDAEILRAARGGADYLLAQIDVHPEERDPGLYSGTAGIGFALHCAFKETGDHRYQQGAERCVRMLKDRAKPAGVGVAWNETTDIISGSAGIGLTLLYAAHEQHDPDALNLAVRAGKRLIELGQAESGGLKWAMDPHFPRQMPNFSHGTAGVCYFLATLYQASKEKKFLDAAQAGARYLQAVAHTEGDTCLIFHHEPGGNDLYYLGWCHGPVGTARLFYRLHQVTGDHVWMDWVHKCARALLQSGLPEKRTPGYWNNVSQCCGAAGVADLFLSLYHISHDPAYLAFSKRMAADVLARATHDKEGLRWIQAENRVSPNDLAAQTGYMQGAAGIGMLFLHLDAQSHHRTPTIVLPDSPFR